MSEHDEGQVTVLGPDEKVRENRVRRMAARQGLTLQKSRTRDPLALTFGQFYLVETATGEQAHKGADLGGIEKFLNRGERANTPNNKRERALGMLEAVAGLFEWAKDEPLPPAARLKDWRRIVKEVRPKLERFFRQVEGAK